MVNTLFTVLNIVTLKVSERGKVKNYVEYKDVAQSYTYLKSYYKMDGDKIVYSLTKMVDLLSLELRLNSPEVYGKYLSTFKYIWDKLE